MGYGSDLDITENGPTLANGVGFRKRQVFKKTKGSELRKQNADRYKGYEERKISKEENLGFSGDEKPNKRQRYTSKGFNFK